MIDSRVRIGHVHLKVADLERRDKRKGPPESDGPIVSAP